MRQVHGTGGSLNETYKALIATPPYTKLKYLLIKPRLVNPVKTTRLKKEFR